MSSVSAFYADLSGYYDRFCQDIDYPEQAAFAARVFAAFNDTSEKRLLDLACGTGQHLQALADHGFVPTGLDNSPAMLAQALQRCADAQWIRADFSELNAPACFDFITCFLYSLHYAFPQQAYRIALSRAFDALAVGGVMLFDVVDKQAIGERDVVSTCVEEHQTLHFRSGWRYDGGEAMQLHLAIEQVDSSERRVWHDQHLMTAATITEVQQWMEEIGFDVTVLERDFSRLVEWRGETGNVMMVGVKRR